MNKEKKTPKIVYDKNKEGKQLYSTEYSIGKILKTLNMCIFMCS